MDCFTAKIENYILDNGLLLPGDRVLAGVSGGADSICLLRVLALLKERLGITLYAVHVHHGLRETADRDALFTTECCKALGVPCEVIRVNVKEETAHSGCSEEEAARNLRYAAFRSVMARENLNRLAAAHHMNDQAETILFRMVRGSGLRGLSGMRPEHEGLVRPLLCVKKQEILEWMTENGFSWCEDETNAGDAASRNRIRHHVIPALESVRQDAVEKITDTGEYLKEADDFFRTRADKWLDEFSHVGENGLMLDAQALKDLEPIEREYAAAEALRRLGIPMKDKTREQLRCIAALTEKQTGKRAELPGGAGAVREYGAIRVFAESGIHEESEEVSGFSVKTRIFPYEKSVKIPEKQYTKWFDCDKIKDTVVFRKRQPGDLFSTLPGTRKKLKDFLIDEKIPREKRDELCLAADGENILWVIGVRMSEAYKVTDSTVNVLEIEVTAEK